MQVMPGTWDYVQQNLAQRPLDPNSATDNVHAGVMYLKRLLDETGGDENAAIAGYYQGLAVRPRPRHVRRHAALRRQRAGAALALRRLDGRAGAVGRPARSRSRSTARTKFARAAGVRVRTFRAMTRPRQIVAFGGGGFSMEAGNPLLGRLRARAGRGGGPRPAEGLLPADRLRRRRPLHRPLLPPLRRRAAASRRTSRCSGATAAPTTCARTCSSRTSSTSAAAA